MDNLKNDPSITKSFLSPKAKKTSGTGEGISESSRFQEQGAIRSLLRKELLYHLEVRGSFEREFMRGITACQCLFFAKHSHD
jgi:hypothetical protein